MIKTIVVVSTFDGISVGLLALRAIYPNHKIIYYAIEIDEKAIKISKHNNPDTDLLSIHYLGDIRKVTKDMIPEQVDYCFSGSPCQSFSIAGKQTGFEGKSGLFWEFIRLKKELNPTYFLLENVSMKKEWMDVISSAVGVKPILFNSSLVSAQNRKRFYWTNIPNVTLPESRRVMLSYIADGAIGGGGSRNIFVGNYKPDGTKKYDTPNFTIRKDGKSNCLTCSSGCDKIVFKNGLIRPLTIDEWERLQTLPIGYTDVPGLSISARKHAIGNSWTLDVIKHIFSFLPY